MSKAQKILIAALAALAGLVVMLALRNPQPPLMPADADHASWEGAAACLTCHAPDGPVPQSKSHPLGHDCGRCHGNR